MTPITIFAGRKVALFGLGGSGLATARALKAGGADVVACDDNTDAIAKARSEGISTADLRGGDWSQFAALVLAPGVPLTHPEPHWTVTLARAAGKEVIGDIELFCRERVKRAADAPFVAITGTNGKSTTTALIAHVLREAGRDVAMGGNIGTAILSLPPPDAERVHVVEMSSFQIDLTPTLAPGIGVMMNVSPDHLDRHGTLADYAAIKERLVAASDIAVIGVDDDISREMAARVSQSGTIVRTISGHEQLRHGFYASRGRVFKALPDEDKPLASIAGIPTLRGTHNAQNAAAAAAVADALGLTPGEIQRGFDTFPGLPHRMEEVGRIGSVLFVNDSKATNADSAAKALASYDSIYWILGGKPKEGGIAPLAEFFPKIAHAYLVGEASDAFAATLGDAVPHTRCGTIDAAVAKAAADAAASTASEPVVLLSPACASYDQFRNFELRGDHFRALVRALPGLVSR